MCTQVPSRLPSYVSVFCSQQMTYGLQTAQWSKPSQKWITAKIAKKLNITQWQKINTKLGITANECALPTICPALKGFSTLCICLTPTLWNAAIMSVWDQYHNGTIRWWTTSSCLKKANACDRKRERERQNYESIYHSDIQCATVKTAAFHKYMAE